MKPNVCMRNMNMPMMGMLPCQYQQCPMNQPHMKMIMPSELEAMYPKVYYVIYPHVQRHCDMMEKKHGMMHEYCEKDIEEISENIYKDCERELDDDYYKDDEDDRNSDDDNEMIRRRRRGRRAVRDLIDILLIRELIGRRRRRPYYGYYGEYGY